MLLDRADCIGSTGAGARINTPLIETGKVAGTLCVYGALRSAVGRHSDIVWLAGTGSHKATLSTGGEGATWSWVARVHWGWLWWWRGYHYSDALTEWIPREAWRALADWVVVGHLAPGVVATDTWAWVYTLLVDAGGQMVAVRADHALRAAGRGDSLVRGKTGAHTHSIDFSVLTVWSTGVPSTWVQVCFNWGWWYECTGRQRVTVVAAITCADGVVIPDGALSIASTGSRARVPALLLHTGEVVGALGVNQTFRPTTNIRVSDMILDTATGTSSIS